jgi:hypothetical protein
VTQTTTTLPPAIAPLVDLVVAEVERRIAEREDGCSGSDWVDQRRSPLGRKLHCQLVRDGELPGRKVHRRVLVRRRDLDAYVETHGTAPEPESPVARDDEARLLARYGARRVAA